MNDGAVEAVLFDLDDTLYPQAEFLAGAWRAVAAESAALGGLTTEQVLEALQEVAAEGSDRGRIIDRAFERLGRTDIDVAPFLAAFRCHAPARLRLYPGARLALRSLRAYVPIGLVTDGDPAVQHSKLSALGLEGAFDVIVFSDELGREHRKPDPLPFTTAIAALGVEGQGVVYIGDRYDKDVVGATAAGLRAIRVLTGEYVSQGGGIAPWRQAADVVAAIALCGPHLAVTTVS